MKKPSARTLAAILPLIAATPSHASILASVDPNGSAPAGGSVVSTRHVASSGMTFDGTDHSTIYLGVHMSRTGGGSFYHGFELYNGAPAAGDTNRALQITDENTGGLKLRLNNNNATSAFVHDAGQYTHFYVIKVEFNANGANEVVSVFLDPLAGTSEAANTAVATATADLAFSHAGFASFVNAAQVSYRNVDIATSWDDLVTTMDSGLIAAEPFDYTDGALAGTGGGSGWYTPWSGSGSVASGKNLTTTSAFGTRALDTNFAGSPTRPLYFSARFTKTGTDPSYAFWLQLGDSAVVNRRDARIGMADGKFSLRLSDTANVETNGDFGSHPVGEEVRLVGKLEFDVDGGSNERLTLWANPTGEETAAVTSTITGGNLGWLTPTHVRTGNFVFSGGNALIDDLRVGTGWNDVWNSDATPALTVMGYDESGGFMVHASGLNPSNIYILTRSADLDGFPDQIGTPITGLATVDLTDPAPPAGRAFYRLEETP